MKSPPIYCWTEPVDANMVAVHARVRFVQRQWIYGLTTFVLIDRKLARSNWDQDSTGWGYLGERMARAALGKLLHEEHYGSIPAICRIDENNTLGIA